MAQPNFIPMPWAENGQKQDPIPAEQTSAGNGRASWKTGFPIENTRPVSNGGVPANYQDFQGVLHTLSEFACYQQAGGIFTWSDELDYEVGARVLGSDNNVYVAIANSGPSSVVTDPVDDTSGKWETEPNIMQASAAALEVASGFVTSGGYTINNGFTVTGGVINGQITSAQYASAIGNTSTNIGACGVPVYVSGGVVTPCDGVAVTSAAQTFSGEKTFTSVISGGVTGNAGTATRLQTARNIQTNLANTSAVSFNGTANVTPGVTGTLAVANGGTGVTTIANIQAGKDGDGNVITSTYTTKAEHDAAIENLDETKAGKDTVAVNTKNIANIESLLNGALSTQQTDATSAYTKSVPVGVVQNAEVQSIAGKTLAWNQLATKTGEDTVVAGAQQNFWIGNSIPFTEGHKYLIRTTQKTTLTSVERNTFAVMNMATSSIEYESGQANYHLEAGEHCWIYTSTFTGNARILLWVVSPNVDVTYSNFMIHDLTMLFGAGNEPVTVDAFRAMFPASYYAYNAGTLISAGVTGAVSVGRNLLPPAEAGTKTLNGITVVSDGKGTFTITGATSTNSVTIIFDLPSDFVIPVSFGRGGNYCFCLNNTFVLSSGSGLRLLYDDTGVDSWEFNEVNRQNCVYVGMGRKTINKIGFLIGAGTSVNGTCSVAFMPYDGDTSNHYHFSPYMTDTLPIPAAVQALPGYGWSAGSVCNEVDWANKKYIQRVASVDLGTLSWSYADSSSIPRYITSIPTLESPINSSTAGNMTMPKYPTMPYSTGSGLDKVIFGYVKGTASEHSIGVKDSAFVADAAAFKTAMSGVMLYYELATPVETDISSLLSDDNLIEVEPGGTISFPSVLGDDYRIPVPSTEEYTIDLAPDMPSTDGTYTLQCVVEDGVASYEWVSAE